jgi:Na+/H+ antiporter NhaD/arsenite permease-like protein
MKYFTLGIAAIMYALVIAFPKKKAWFTLGAAALAVAIGAVGPIHALRDLINWNVLLIYIGSLIIADLCIYSRVPSRNADKIVDRSPALGIGIVAILVMTGLLSAFVENVATALVMAPIALAVSRKAGIPPAAFMIGLAVMANLQGTATLVGDPPSMIFAGYAGYRYAPGTQHVHLPRRFLPRREFNALRGIRERGSHEPREEGLGKGCPIRRMVQARRAFTLLTTAASALILWVVWR